MKFILRFLKPYWKICVFIVFLLTLDVAGTLYIPTLAAQMLNAGTMGSTPNVLVNTGIKMAIASIISGLGALLSGYVCSILSAKVGKDIRDSLYKKSLKLSIYDFRQFGTASITTRTIADVTNIQLAVVSFIQMVLPVPIIFVIALTLSFRLDMQLGFILLCVVLIVIILAGLIMKKASPLSRLLQKKLDRMGEILLENITGVRVIRAFNKESSEQNRLDNSFSDYGDTAIKTNKLFASLDGLSFLSINIFMVIVYWISGGSISAGRFQIGDISAITEYAILILFYLMMAQMIILTMPRALECCRRVQEVLEYTPEIKDNVSNDTTVALEKSKDVLRFKDVSFRFSDAEEDTLSHLDFTCRRGETTAIIGGTGSGKSTIASLILRFNDVTTGAIYLNDQDIRDMSQHNLRKHLGYVQQKAWLLSGTIADNVRYGNQKATESELKHALKVAQADDFVSSLPDKLESFVAQGGINFSGGQKQRISIARALIKKPELYIFDDSFSALDFKTDAALRKALSNETQDSAVLIIAQRISSIQDANQIIVLDEGKVAGIGTHDELMKNCLVYQEIYKSQTKEEKNNEVK